MIASLLSRIGIEVWKDIPNYEGLYQVSNLGNARSLNYRRTGKVKNLVSSNCQGRPKVFLSKKGLQINSYLHVLVSITFLNHKPKGYKIVVDHIDNNKLNNKLYNLQLITHRENMSKDRKNKTSKYTGVHWHKNHKKWYANIYIKPKTKYLGLFTDEKKAAQAYQNELKKINETKEAHTDTTHT